MKVVGGQIDYNSVYMDLADDTWLVLHDRLCLRRSTGGHVWKCKDGDSLN